MALEQMLNLIKASFLLFFIFFNSLVSTQESILPGEPQVAEIVKKIPQSIERLRRKRKLDRYLWNKKLKKIQDTITSALSTVGLISIGYLIYNKCSPETSSGGFFFNNNKEEEIYSPGTKTVKTSFRCLLFAVANSLSWEPDFVWPEAGIADDEAGKKLDRIEKARRIVRFLDVEFKKYAETAKGSSAKNIKAEANGSFVSSDNFNIFFNNKFPEIAKRYSYLIVKDTELSCEKYGCPLFLLRLFHNVYDANGEKTENFEVFSIQENKHTKVIYDKIGEFSIDKSYRQTPINYSGDHSLGLAQMFKNKSIIVGDGSHYVCVHCDGEKLIQCNDMAPSNPKVWSSIKNDLEKFFGVN